MIEGLDLRAGQTIWFGELHGTEESPRFVGDVVEQAIASQRVQLGLELPSREQPTIDQFLADGDRDRLVQGEFWTWQDGRSSVAMVALLERMRRLRTKGAPLHIIAYDARDTSPDLADRGMAEAVLEARDPAAVFIGLSGNIHSRRTRWRDITPAVMHLIDAGVNVTTYNAVASGGTYWACVSRGNEEPVCGEHENEPAHDPGPPWTLGPARDDSHDGVYFVGTTRASPPARR